MHQTLSMGVAPENFFGALFELCIQMRRFPIACAMRLQVHRVQNTPHSARADRRYNALNHHFAGQVLTAPVGNVQPLSDRFQTRQLHNLGTLQGGKSRSDAPRAAPRPRHPPAPPLHSADTAAKPWTDHTASERPRSERVRLRRWPTPPVLVGLETTAGCGCVQSIRG